MYACLTLSDTFQVESLLACLLTRNPPVQLPSSPYLPNLVHVCFMHAIPFNWARKRAGHLYFVRAVSIALL
jgi:hypothetical protein